MFGLGGTELVIIVVVAILIFGPNKLPELGRVIGKAMNEFKRATSEMEDVVRKEISDIEKTVDETEVDGLARDAARDARPLTPAASNPEELYDDDFEYEDEE